MRKISIPFILMLFTVNAYAQHWSDELSGQLVQVKEGKMTSTELNVITLVSDGTSMQVTTYAEAPANDFISRDRFVAIFSTTFYVLIEKMLSEQGLSEDDYKTKTVGVDDLIGTADIELSCFMGKNGIQVVVAYEGEEKKITKTWDSVFE